jgi:hypothetical protein
MPRSTSLTKEEKQNGKRKLLIPSKEIQVQMHQRSKDRLISSAAIVAERVFIAVGLQILGANRVEHATDSRFSKLQNPSIVCVRIRSSPSSNRSLAFAVSRYACRR